MLPFNQNLASLSIKVSSRSIIRRKRSDDKGNSTGKTYNFVLPPDTKFRKRYPRFFLVIW